MVVAGPWPGSTRSWSSSVGQPGDRLDHRLGRAARQVHPAPAAGEERVAAERDRLVGGEQADRSPPCGPGVWRTSSRTSPNRITPPSASSTAGTDGGMSNGAQSGAGVEPVAVRGMDGDLRAGVRGHRRVVADVVPVAVGRHDQLQRPAARRQLVLAIQSSDGMAVSIAIASPGRSSARSVDVGGDRADDPTDDLHRAMMPDETMAAAPTAPGGAWSRDADRSDQRRLPDRGLTHRSVRAPRASSSCRRTSGRSSCWRCPR